jgi:hypothetical protein
MQEPAEKTQTDLASSRLLRGILSGEQFLALTGHDPAEISAVLDTTLAGLPGGHVRTVRVGKPDAPNWSISELVNDIACIGAEQSGDVLDHACDRLIKAGDHERQVLLVVGEAERLDLPALRFLQMLPAISGQCDPSLQILLVGAPEFGGRLMQPELRGLRGQLATFVALSLDNERRPREMSRSAGAIEPEADAPDAGAADFEVGWNSAPLVRAALSLQAARDPRPARHLLCGSIAESAELSLRAVRLPRYRPPARRSGVRTVTLIGSVICLGVLLVPTQVSYEYLPVGTKFYHAIVAVPQGGHEMTRFADVGTVAPASPVVLVPKPTAPANTGSGSDSRLNQSDSQTASKSPSRTEPALSAPATAPSPGATAHLSEPPQVSTIARVSPRIVPQSPVPQPVGRSEPEPEPNTSAPDAAPPTPRAEVGPRDIIPPPTASAKTTPKRMVAPIPDKALALLHVPLRRDFDKFLRELGSHSIDPNQSSRSAKVTQRP